MSKYDYIAEGSQDEQVIDDSLLEKDQEKKIVKSLRDSGGFFSGLPAIITERINPLKLFVDPEIVHGEPTAWFGDSVPVWGDFWRWVGRGADDVPVISHGVATDDTGLLDYLKNWFGDIGPNLVLLAPLLKAGAGVIEFFNDLRNGTVKEAFKGLVASVVDVVTTAFVYTTSILSDFSGIPGAAIWSNLTLKVATGKSAGDFAREYTKMGLDALEENVFGEKNQEFEDLQPLGPNPMAAASTVGGMGWAPQMNQDLHYPNTFVPPYGEQVPVYAQPAAMNAGGPGFADRINAQRAQDPQGMQQALMSGATAKQGYRSMEATRRQQAEAAELASQMVQG